GRGPGGGRNASFRRLRGRHRLRQDERVSDELGTPRLSELPRYPVAGGVAGLSIAATLAWLVGADADALVLDVRAFLGQPWRLVTSALLHVDFVHLAFDVYWVWRFGSAIERRFGHLRTLL